MLGRRANVVMARRCSCCTCSWRPIRRPLAAQAGWKQTDPGHRSAAHAGQPLLNDHQVPPGLLQGGRHVTAAAAAAAAAVATLLLVTPVQALDSGSRGSCQGQPDLGNYPTSNPAFHSRFHPSATIPVQWAAPGTVAPASTAAGTSRASPILMAAGGGEGNSSSCSTTGCSGCTWCGCQGMDQGDDCGCGPPAVRQGVTDPSKSTCKGGGAPKKHTSSPSAVEGTLADHAGNTSSCSCPPAQGGPSPASTKQVHTSSGPAQGVLPAEGGLNPPGQQQQQQQQQPPTGPQQPHAMVPRPAMPSAPMPLPLSPCPAPQAEPLPRCPANVPPPVLLPPAPSAPTAQSAPHG